MSAVIDEKKRINAEIPMNLYQKIEATGYKTTEAIVKGFEKLLEGEGDSNFDEQIKQMENKILAAESRTESKEKQISELSSWIEEKDRLISSLDTKIRKLTAPKQKTWPYYIAGISTFQIWSIGFSFLLGMLFMSIYFYYYI
ncbi:hypothetical protein MSSAC_0200 [Methanosarcina siciliae C2J]|uniref:Uncharacterized protein n=2 Tax=Methanosarcina siciliae TaxID=38027 RepID=A0A0E3PK94_9EURY|nr:hypothetical protein MSSAC_0200 [Methanosarcina siciliae C2J]